MNWAKVAANFFASRKVRRAGPYGALVFLHVLCENAARDASGSVPVEEIDDDRLADSLRLPFDLARAGREAAISAGLLVLADAHVAIAGWDTEWSRRPLSDAERKRLQRAREAVGKAESHGAPVTGHEANVTDRDVTDQRRSDQIRKEEREIAREASPAALLSLAVELPPSKPRRKRNRKPVDELDVRTAARVRNVLEKLAERTGKAYGGDKEHVRLVADRLRDGASVWDLRLVIGYCAHSQGWERDPAMRVRLNPHTLFGPKNFARYLSEAKLEFSAEPIPPDALALMADDNGNEVSA